MGAVKEHALLTQILMEFVMDLKSLGVQIKTRAILMQTQRTMTAHVYLPNQVTTATATV